MFCCIVKHRLLVLRYSVQEEKFNIFIFILKNTILAIIVNWIAETISWFVFHVQVEAHLDTLVNEQAAMVLNRVGLAEAYRTVQAYQPKQVKPSWKAVIDWLIQ